MALWHSGRAGRDGLRARLLVLTHRYLVDNGFLPIVLSGPPAEHPKAKIWQNSVAAIDRDMDWLFMPALAALTGGVLSVVWSACALVAAGGCALWSVSEERHVSSLDTYPLITVTALGRAGISS